MDVKEPALIPVPRSLECRDGAFRVSTETVISISDETLRDVAMRLANFLGKATGIVLPVTTDRIACDRAIHLSVVPALGPESYELEVSRDRVTVEAGDASGVFYAAQSLRQLLPAAIESMETVTGVEWTIPCLRVSDAPEYTWRGMHLDVSRHFFPVEFIERFLDLMAFHKLNRFHWHLTDDQGWRIEIRKYPRLTEVGAWRDETVSGHTLSRGAETDGRRHGGYYSQDEIRAVVQYAAERFITVVPEFDLPGHGSALLAAYPEYGCREGDYRVATHFGIFPDVVCPCEETFSMIADVIGEIAALFPGPYIHIGGDEVDVRQWRESDKCRAYMAARGLDDTRALQRDFVERVTAIVADLGRTAIGWDDVLEGDPAESMTITTWRGEEHVDDAVRSGHRVIVTPGAFYFDYYQSTSNDEPLAIHGVNTLRDVYEFEFVPGDFDQEQRKRVLGAQACAWTEYMATAEQVEYMCFPRMCALAERVWSRESQLSWPAFVRRLRRHFPRLDALGVNASRSVYNVHATAMHADNGSLRIALHSDADDSEIRFSLDGTAPDQSASRYVEPIEVREPTVVRAVNFDRANGCGYGDTVMQAIPHKALGCAVEFANEPERLWPGDPARAVVDGIAARASFFRHGEWAGFNGEDMDATIDLGDVTEIQEAAIGFDAAVHRRLHWPTGLEVRVSVCGADWRTVARLGAEHIDADAGELKADFETCAARFVRVIASNDTRIFSHEAGADVPVSLYVDEIVIR